MNTNWILIFFAVFFIERTFWLSILYAMGIWFRYQIQVLRFSKVFINFPEKKFIQKFLENCFCIRFLLCFFVEYYILFISLAKEIVYIDKQCVSLYSGSMTFIHFQVRKMYALSSFVCLIQNWFLSRFIFFRFGFHRKVKHLLLLFFYPDRTEIV